MTLSVLECLTHCGIQRTGDCDWGSLHSCGLILHVLAFFWSVVDAYFTMFCLLSLCCTLSFIAMFTACCNRRLLRELLFSFDFCFITVQLSMLMTLDALTPKTRQDLGLRIRFVIPLVAYFVLVISQTSMDIVSLTPSQPYQDRVLWSVVIHGSHTLEFHSVPFPLNRVWLLVLYGENDCIVIQGNVEFVANKAAVSKRKASILQASVIDGSTVTRSYY
uniref:Uncharacterized protein n=1 Tax=Globisporangium ultimum (strain ATCC 200006 / CBS 805.95 / DAOM BR144) TaxID=431595 RepID=K3WWL1_GLOUD